MTFISKYYDNNFILEDDDENVIINDDSVEDIKQEENNTYDLNNEINKNNLGDIDNKNLKIEKAKNVLEEENKKKNEKIGRK